MSTALLVAAGRASAIRGLGGLVGRGGSLPCQRLRFCRPPPPAPRFFAVRFHLKRRIRLLFVSLKPRSDVVGVKSNLPATLDRRWEVCTIATTVVYSLRRHAKYGG